MMSTGDFVRWDDNVEMKDINIDMMNLLELD